MDDTLDALAASAAQVECHLEGIQWQLGRHRGGAAPADDATVDNVDHKRCVGRLLPGRDVREVDHPELIRRVCAKDPIDQVRWPPGARVGARGCDVSRRVGRLPDRPRASTARPCNAPPFRPHDATATRPSARHRDRARPRTTIARHADCETRPARRGRRSSSTGRSHRRALRAPGRSARPRNEPSARR